MKKILFITAFTPEENCGGGKNTIGLINDLSKSFEVDLIYWKSRSEGLYTSPNKNVFIRTIFKSSRLRQLLNILLMPFLYRYFTVKFNWLSLISIRSIIKKNKYDVVFFDHSQVFLYSKFIDKKTPKFLLSLDVISQRVSRLSNKFIQKFCELSESFCLSAQNSYSMVLNEKDRSLIKQFFGIDSAVCSVYFDEKVTSCETSVINDEFVFFGNWIREDNLNGLLWFLDQVLPLIKDPIKIKIIGSVNYDFSNYNKKNIDIISLGFVDNPYSIISNCRAMIAPLFTGAGVKVKVIESFACGTPVIGTEIAFEGISKDYSSMMFKAHTPQEYAQYINNADKLNFSPTEREDFKNKFLETYQSETIPNLIYKLIE
jgi:glycosyltransferase involved in cell wall biosynthesis